jgi:transaldolase/glucose-6-phosphate isomerase
MTRNPGFSLPAEVSSLQPVIQNQLDALDAMKFLDRFNQRDVTLWSSNPADQDEIAHRLGWLDAAKLNEPVVKEAEKLLEEVLSEGYTHAVVLGMGGSSLAPEVYSQFMDSFGEENKNYLLLSILDSTSPEQIIKLRDKLPLAKTLFIVSSKSGSTVEVKTLFSYFWELVEKQDPENAGRHFIAISDPGTQLQDLAKEKGFRRAIQADPNVGGRYSALIAFGLVPAILAGFDGKKILKWSQKLSSAQIGHSISYDNPGLQLGIVLGSAYLSGKDKLTILADSQTESMGSWIEQLVAESSGKDGKGIIPVAEEPLLSLASYQTDRIFVYLRAKGGMDDTVRDLVDHNYPVYICDMPELYDLAAEFYRWEVAIAVACVILGVDAFNQPNVQESKDIAKHMLDTLKKGDDLEIGSPVWEDDCSALYSKSSQAYKNANIKELLLDFVGQGQTGDFIAINAFIERNEENELKLESLRKLLTQKTSLPTTMGFGPRFLHSTGQLHKGGRNNGLFIVISQNEEQKLVIPGEGISFNGLIFAQALSDTLALESHDRRVIRLHFKEGKFQLSNLNQYFNN